MNIERQILRENDRNICYREFNVDKYIFTKTSTSVNGNAAEEYYFWKYFFALNTGMIPFCNNCISRSKTIQYEWLDGYTQLSGKYTSQILEKILWYIDLNARVNTFDNLKYDNKIVALSEKRLQQQLAYYADIREKAKILYNSLISKTLFDEMFDASLNVLCCKDVLCHGDLGRSNILIKDADIKIVDFEYSMFSAKELDYGRLLSSIFLSYQNNIVKKNLFFEMVAMIAKSPLKLDKLARCAGLQLIMRNIHAFVNKSRISNVSYDQFNIAIRLLSVKDNITANKVIDIFQ